MDINKEIEWNKKVFEAYNSLLIDATKKLGFIKGELETYNKRSKKEQKQTAWITVELIQKIMDGKYDF